MNPLPFYQPSDCTVEKTDFIRHEQAEKKHAAFLKRNVAVASCQCVSLKCLLTLRGRLGECTIDSYKLPVKVDLLCIQDD